MLPPTVCTRRTAFSLWSLWALLLISMAQPSLAHHSRSAFALDEQMKFRGTVTQLGWHNPHAYLVVQGHRVTDTRSAESGPDAPTPTTWTFEAHSISGLTRLGWSRHSVKPGEQITVVANPNRNPAEPFALLDQVIRADGSALYAFRQPNRNKATTSTLRSKDFSGTWKPKLALRTALVGGFKPPAHWPYTEKAKAEVAQFDINDDPALDCVATGVPRIIKWPYSQRWRVEDEKIVIETDQSPRVRTLHKLSQHNGAAKPATALGFSTFEKHGNNELVVTSRNFAATRWGAARGVSSGTEKTVTERYTLATSGQELRVTYTLHDPEFLEQAVEVSAQFELIPDYAFNDVPCDPAVAKRHLQFQ